MLSAFTAGACADLLDCRDSGPNILVVRSNVGRDLSAGVVGRLFGLALCDLASVSQEVCGWSLS